MTPQEKAKDLVDKFYNFTMDIFIISKSLECSKNCALIAVDEILSDTEEIDGMRVINNPYWLEVKNEIEKL
jgi:hypothetical protein